MSQSNFEEFPEVPKGFAPLEPIPENIAPEDVAEYLRQLNRVYLHNLKVEDQIRIIAEKRFNDFLLYPLARLYDTGLQDSDQTQQPELFNARAIYLMRNKFLQMQFAFYQIEYSVLENYCYSHISLNFGMRYKALYQHELRGTYSDNIETLSRLISETEKYLRKTIRDVKPPYLVVENKRPKS